MSRPRSPPSLADSNQCPPIDRGARSRRARPHQGGARLSVQSAANLVENALRHTKEWTTVSIVVGTNPPSIKVIDHGPGVRQDQRQAIFRRFWQGARDQKGGAGLGLDIAARTVVAHGGIISVDEAPEGGAVSPWSSMRFPPRTQLSIFPSDRHQAAPDRIYDCDLLAAVRPL